MVREPQRRGGVHWGRSAEVFFVAVVGTETRLKYKNLAEVDKSLIKLNDDRAFHYFREQQEIGEGSKHVQVVGVQAKFFLGWE